MRDPDEFSVDIVLAEDHRTVIAHLYRGDDELVGIQTIAVLPMAVDEQHFLCAEWAEAELQRCRRAFEAEQ